MSKFFLVILVLFTPLPFLFDFKYGMKYVELVRYGNIALLNMATNPGT